MANLPDPVLSRLVAGFVLSYFRSIHPTRGRLHVLQHPSVPIVGTNYVRDFDFGIFDEATDRMVAAFQLAKDAQSAPGKLEQIRIFQDNLQQAPRQTVTLGLVVPEPVAGDQRLRKKAADLGVEVVSYPV